MVGWRVGGPASQARCTTCRRCVGLVGTCAVILVAAVPRHGGPHAPCLFPVTLWSDCGPTVMQFDLHAPAWSGASIFGLY